MHRAVMYSRKVMREKLFLIIGSLFLGLLIFLLILKSKALQLYCLRKIHIQIENVRKAAFQLGVIHIDEEEKYMKSIKNDLYKQCLLQENN